MSIRIKIFLFFGLLSYFPALAQVDTAWVRRYNGRGNGVDSATALAVDDSGNVYVTGGSFGNGTFLDYATIKYGSNGNILWVRTYDGPASGDDIATAIEVDGKGNVYVTGTSDGVWGVTYFDYATIKYASNGAILWVRRYNGPLNNRDLAAALTIDGKENVYVTGTSWGGITGDDYATVKYGPDGNTIWVKRYNGPEDTDDIAKTLAIDDGGNVYVTGYSSKIFPLFEILTIKYNSDGKTLWARRYKQSDSSYNIPYALAVDTDRKVYIAGISCDTIGCSYVTIKYFSNGDTFWTRLYTGIGNVNVGNQAPALTVDNKGNEYVTGVVGIFPENDFITIKYSSYGDELWSKKYNGPWNNEDVGKAIAVDSNGFIYVTGYSNLYLDYDYATIKYTLDGDTVWVRRYDGLANGHDFPSALKVDNNGNVYVTGASSSPSSYDYVTIKYVQFECIALTGDATADNKILLPDIVTLVNYLFKSQPAPKPFCRGDANADSNIQLSDIMYLINFIFKSGSAPVKSRECCL